LRRCAQLELDVKVPFGMRNHEIVVVSLIGGDSCRVTFT